MMIQSRCLHTTARVAGAMACAALALQVNGQTELTKITASDGTAGENFGFKVAIAGNSVIVGAWHESPPSNSGAAYVFADAGSGWAQQGKLIASDRASFDEFGVSVGIVGDYAAVGAWQDIHLSISSGSAYVFHRVGSTWTQTQKLLAPDRANADGFGISLAMDGNVLAIGADRGLAPGFADAGSVYVFRFNGSSWAFEQKLNAADPANLDAFGSAVAVNGNTIVVGSRQDDDAGTSSGSAYVFVHGGSAWSQEAKLTASDAASLNNFGNSVALNGDTAVIGSFADANEAGSAYIFKYAAGAWNETSKLIASDATDLQHFSSGALALSSDQILIAGSPADSDAGIGSGSAYLFDLNSTAETDTDGDGLTDSQELAIGTDPFNADTDNDSLPDGFEVSLAAGSGCPDPLNFDSDGDGVDDGTDRDSGLDPCDADVDDDGLSDGQELALGTDPHNPDTDGDTLSDGAEIALAAGSGCPSPLNTDSDGDGLSDGAENALGTSPCNTDSDGDGLTDGLEIAFGTNPLVMDSDSDGLTDGQEVAIAAGSGCPNPLVADSDGDELSDGFEHAGGLNPCDADTDHDGLSDGNENTHGTSPSNPDTDGDGLLDGFEVTLAAGSGCPSPVNADSDGDGLSDGNELTAGLGPCDIDSDNDGLSDGNESAFGTNPLIGDTDGDGLLDGTEVDIAQGTGCPNPLNGDSDGDSLLDGSEITAGSNPCNTDTDGDGVADNVDPSPLTPGVPPAFLASMTLTVADEVQQFNLSLFLAPNGNAANGRRTALSNNLHDAATAINKGKYASALASLMMVANKVDGASPPPDWLAPSPQQAALYADVQTLIQLIDLLQ